MTPHTAFVVHVTPITVPKLYTIWQLQAVHHTVLNDLPLDLELLS